MKKRSFVNPFCVSPPVALQNQDKPVDKGDEFRYNLFEVEKKSIEFHPGEGR